MRDLDLTAAMIGVIFIALGVALGGDVLDWWGTEPGLVAATAVLAAGGSIVLGTLWRDRPGG